ncbi:MAG TPA: hypothetical protein VGS23_07140 [Thermoplasmata archaeon]|nr:hypothetical protein [Thermoplasmata archaeon]
MPKGPDLTAVLKGRRARPVGTAVASELEQRRRAYEGARPEPIGRLAISVDGKPYPGFYEALLDPEARFERAELSVSDWAPKGPAADFVRPFERLVFHPDGSADLYPRTGSPERAIARLQPREGFGTPPAGPEFGGGRLPTLAQFTEATRSGGFVPFGLAIDLYGSSERLRYDLDLGDLALLPDPRAGRIPTTLGRRRTSRASWNFDRVLSGAGLTPSAARVLETVWELGSVSEPDLARVFGVEEGGAEAILRLRRLHLIESDPGSGGWRFRLEALVRPARPPHRPSGPRESETPLRHSMGELLAGAEARATCPMCGEEFPVGPRGILCERCTREVENASRAR